MTTTRTLTLRSLDVPSIAKFGLGFDSTINELLRLSESQTGNYPPFNIVKQTEDKFYVQVAVAGFSEGDIQVSVENQWLTITGSTTSDTDGLEYIHHGISNRDFTRTFRLGEHVEVVDAQHKDGILTIYVERQLPEALLPKTIDIKYIK